MQDIFFEFADEQVLGEWLMTEIFGILESPATQ
jgi:hypothetical protein